MPLSILHVHTQPVVSGSGINTLLTIRGSLDRGHRVGIACGSEGRLTEQVRRAGAAVHVVPQLGNEITPVRDSAAVLALRKLMRRARFDLVHTHNSKAGFIGRLAARLAGVPVVIHTVHGFAFHDAETLLRQALFRRLERLAAGWCDGMIFISQPLIEWARRERIGLNVPRILIYSGIDIDAFRAAGGARFRQQFGIPPERLVVGMISKLWEGKGHDVLLRAWRKLLDRSSVLPPPLLLIVGEGPLEGRLKTLAAELQVQDYVRFTGFQGDLPEITAAIDVSVLPSLFEGMGRVVLEAMAAGKPIVASKTGGIPDLVRHGENGLLVQPGNVESLEAALVEILTKSDLRDQLARGATAAVRPEHSAAFMVEEIHAFYDKVRNVASPRGQEQAQPASGG